MDKNTGMADITTEISSMIKYFGHISESIKKLDSSVTKRNPVKHAAVIAAIAGLTVLSAPCADASDFIDKYSQTGTREYTFSSATDIENITTNLSTMGTGTFTVTGIIGETSRSTIDGQNHSLFNLTSGRTLNLSNVEIKNARSSNHGAAIYNRGIIDNVTNSVFTSNSTTQRGGAIANDGSGAKIYNITESNFTSNSSSNNAGAIYNEYGYIGAITRSSFTYNTAQNHGGVIYNSGTIANIIDSTFSNNTSTRVGGVISNNGSAAKIEKITGSTFTSNRVVQLRGGAIFNNNAKINEITGSTFTSNIAVYGGAIFNNADSGQSAKIDIISETIFKSNSAQDGGAFWNNAGSVTNSIKNSTFQDNPATSGSGGAIYTTSALIIGADSGKTTSFTGNTASSQGGAIWSSANLTFNANNGTILFQNNTANSVSNAIYFDGNRTANFNISNGGSVYMYDKIAGSTNYNVVIKNTGDADSTGTFYMYNDFTNANVTTKTTGNKINIDLSNDNTQNVSMKTLSSDNTALYKIDFNASSTPSADTITTTSASSGTVYINAINFYGLTGNETEGYTKTAQVLKTPSTALQLGLNSDLASGVTLYENAVAHVDGIETDVYSNSEYGGYDEVTTLKGGFALADTDTTNDSLKMTITDRTVVKDWTDKYDTLKAWSEQETSSARNFTFVSDKNDYEVTKDLTTVSAGTLNINGIGGDTLSSINAQSHKLFTIGDDTTMNITNVEIKNAVSDTDGGAINNSNVINLSNVLFTNNTASGTANDIHNTGIMRIKEGTTTINGGVTGSGMTNVNGGDLVIADSSNGLTQGTLTINSGSVKSNASKISTSGHTIANAGTIDFTGGTNANAITGTGTTKISGTVTNNALVTQNNLTVTGTGALTSALSNLAISSNTIKNDGILNITNEDEIALDITKDTTGTGKIAISTTGTTHINSTITDNTIELNHGILTFSNPETNIAGANLTNNGCAVNMINNATENLVLGTLTLNNNLDFYADVDLANKTMDRITPTAVAGTENVNIAGLNILSDATQNSTSILFAEGDLKDHVINSVSNVGKGVENPYQTSAYSPLYMYDVAYSSGADGGYMNFNITEFNPAVVAEPVATQTNVMATQNIVTNYAFHHVDTCMTPHHAHLGSRFDNQYALSDVITNDVGTNNPLFIEPDQGSVWIKPFVTFENIPLKNGPNVSSTTYGTLIGYDSQRFHHKHGFDGVWTGYVGYTGAQSHYTGVDISSNGGLMGATYSLYKGDFFNATTITTGAMLDQANTMYGRDNMTTLYAGVGNKTGYNFDFKEGLFVIQPSLLLSYTFANTFDYTNAAGVRIDSDPLHTIQISPGIKFFMNTKNGWQPYIGVNMMWNIMDQTHVKANGVQLPSMSVKPYVQYGIGLQKIMKDHFSAYGQVMLQNGGRNGVSLTAGFRWAIGKNKKIEKVKNKEILKQVQDDTKGARHVLKG